MTRIILLLACILMSSYAQSQRSLNADVERRVDELLSQLSLEEKVSLLGGTGFETRPIERLGIPSLRMTDGPVGVRNGTSTAFPVSIAMAATWDPPLIERLGAALAWETKAKNRDMLLGPCVNIHRVPQGGRDFESFGEDPWLASRMAVAYVRGVQSHGVLACTKHFACNNQEWQRDFTNVRISERALHEIYLPAFKAAVREAGSASIMSAYNKVNGAWCSENPTLLNDILKKQWGFTGLVVSDWGAVHSTVPTANAGCDIEMPETKYMGNDLHKAIGAGDVSQTTIDDKVRRLLRMMLEFGLFERKQETVEDPSGPSRIVSADVAREGIVLLKNDGALLPLDFRHIKTLAVIGPNAAVARTGGGGSSRIDPRSSVTPLQGIIDAVGSSVKVRYAKGCRMEGEIEPVPAALLSPEPGASRHGLKGEYFTNMNLQGEAALTRIDSTLDFDWGGDGPARGFQADSFSVRWTGFLTPPTSGTFNISVRSDDGIRLYVDDRLLLENWSDHAAEVRSATVQLEGGKPYRVVVEFYENGGGAIAQLGFASEGGRNLQDAVEAAKSADAAIVIVGNSADIESEGFDRKSLELPAGQAPLIAAIAAANPRTVVVLQTGAPVLTAGWAEHVPAILETWFPGGEGGRAFADVLSGAMNPSGRLPMTFPARWEDCPAYGNYPGDSSVTYQEGIYVGYRYFDTKKIAPVFPFGHGLSYTTFTYADLAASVDRKTRTVNIAVTVRNSGARDGAEVVQVYIHDMESTVDRPDQELRGFQRVVLKAGTEQRIRFALADNALAFYDEATHGWRVEPGRFGIRVGGSSRDIRLGTTILW